MEYFYILFALLGLYAECSKNINTRNLFKKIGLGLIVFGSLIDISGYPNLLLELGAMSYVAADIWKKYKESKHNCFGRRKTDKVCV